ncbi:hypothetical protein J6590_104657, partial [Homalodisca vitripennis]
EFLPISSACRFRTQPRISAQFLRPRAPPHSEKSCINQSSTWDCWSLMARISDENMADEKDVRCGEKDELR